MTLRRQYWSPWWWSRLLVDAVQHGPHGLALVHDPGLGPVLLEDGHELIKHVLQTQPRGLPVLGTGTRLEPVVHKNLQGLGEVLDVVWAATQREASLLPTLILNEANLLKKA